MGFVPTFSQPVTQSYPGSGTKSGAGSFGAECSAALPLRIGLPGACRMNDDRLTGPGRPIRSRRRFGRVGVPDSHRRRILPTFFILCLCPSLSACSGIQSALDPAGREAADVATLFFTMLAGGVVIWAGVVGMLFYAARKGQVHSEKAAGRVILWCGALLPTVILAALLSYAVWLMPNVRPWFSGDDRMMRRIEVTGEQFWWRVRYLDKGGGLAFETANELRIPVGERVVFSLKSSDVIHSFWIPVLGGKMDMIPGRENRLTLLAEKPGTYRGVCAEFCGASHALMAFTVLAMEKQAFEDWMAARRASSGGQDGEGLALFLRHGCSACHAISGTQARGTIGPDLTAFGERGSVGAGTRPNIDEHVAGFIRDAGRSSRKPACRISPCCRMPKSSGSPSISRGSDDCGTRQFLIRGARGAGGAAPQGVGNAEGHPLLDLGQQQPDRSLVRRHRLRLHAVRGPARAFDAPATGGAGERLHLRRGSSTRPSRCMGR